MIFQEFKTKINELGLKVFRRPEVEFIIMDKNIKSIIATVDKNTPYVMNTNRDYLLDEQMSQQLFHILVKFSQTSIEERHYDA